MGIDRIRKMERRLQMNTQNQKRTTEDYLYLFGWLLLLVVLLICGWHHLHTAFAMPSFLRILGFGSPCKIHELTGFYCPGCGGTRSVIALFHGRFLVSAVDYPLTIYAVVMYLWFMISQTIQRVSRGKYRIGLRWRSGYLWGALAILLAHFVLKNVLYIVTGLTPFLPG